MKTWVLVLLFLSTTKAIASSADSGRCPWKIPFTIHIVANGDLHEYGKVIPTHGPTQYTDNGILPDTEGFDFTLDTSIAYLHKLGWNMDSADRIQYSLLNDTLRFQYSFINKIGLSSNEGSMMIAFAPGKDSILSLTLHTGQQTDNYPFPNEDNTDDFDAQIFSLSFDDTSIFAFDSSFSEHQIVIARHQTSVLYSNPGYGDFGGYSYQDFTASSASVSGIFRPTNFKDSVLGRNPWKLPFQLNIHAVGTSDSSGITLPGSEDLSISVWKCSLNSRDTFLFQSGKQTSGFPTDNDIRDTSLLIAFAPTGDSISYLSLSLYDNFSRSWQGQLYAWTSRYLFQMSSLDYDSASIFTSDSSFCSHHAVMNASIQVPLGGTGEKTFTATSVDLSGIFRPLHYACEQAVSPQPRSDDRLDITSSRKSLHCSFEPSSTERILVAYSVLGSQVAQRSIDPGVSVSTIPNLSPGFYLIRLGSMIAKAYIGE